MARRRFQLIKAKPGELKVQWGRVVRKDPLSLIYSWGAGGTKDDAEKLMDLFQTTHVHQVNGQTVSTQKSLRQELEDRGYDVTTLKFSIMKKT